tara:strand:+ start:149 stop:574 length:426 start_codon:yes stop_codon:yes gene_type:complete
MRLFLLTSLLFFLAACGKNENSISLTNLEIYAPLPGNTVTSGYANITNNTDVTVSIDSITSPNFKTVEIHETIIVSGIARMIEIEQLTIPANNDVVLKRGGKHIMFFDPTENIKIGKNIKLNIKLSNNENLKLEVPAKSRF